LSPSEDHGKGFPAGSEGRSASAREGYAVPGAPNLGRLAHNVFRVAAIIIGGLLGATALLINWFVGRLLW
jgi:hypothetical protein